MPTGFDFTEQDIIKILKEKECKLIGQYISTNNKITIEDKNGYKYYGTFIILKNSKLDKPFTKNNPNTINNIKTWIKLNGYNDSIELLSNEYLSATHKLKWLCKKCGRTFERDWHYMHKENTTIYKTCNECNRKRLTESQTHFESYKDFENEGYKVLGFYNGKHHKCTLLDKNGYLYYTDHNTYFGNNRSPYLFSKFNPYTIYNINKYIDNNNIPVKLISENFMGGDLPLEWECNCGNHFYEICCNVLKGNVRYKRTRCEICSKYQSNISKATEDYLNELNVKNNKEFRFNDCRDAIPLPFDFAIFDNEILKGLIEVDGAQHEKPYSFSPNSTLKDGIKQLEYIKYHDNIKNNYCKNNNIPLLRIKFSEFNKSNTYKKIIDNFLKQINNKDN